MAKRKKKVENEELETQVETSEEVVGEAFDAGDILIDELDEATGSAEGEGVLDEIQEPVETEDDNVLPTVDEPEDLVDEDETPSQELELELDTETPINDVPILDLPGFEKGSKLNPKNPFDVRAARRELARLRTLGK